jgi:hypothetical protein
VEKEVNSNYSTNNELDEQILLIHEKRSSGFGGC